MGERKVTSPGAVLLTVCVAQFMVPLMLTAVAVALPSIGREFSASAQQLGLVVQLYILSPAISMLTFGRLGDLVGRAKIFLIGLILFTVLTASLGFVGSIDMLLIQRFFQGIGASMLLSGSMALVASAFPVEIRGSKVGIVSAFTYSGLSLGPVLGGFITSHLGWRYVFWLVVPFGVAACLLCVFRLRDDFRSARRETMDWQGSLIFALGVALIMLGASHLGQWRTGPLMILGGFAFVLMFVFRETRTPTPLLDVSIFVRNRFFTLSCLAAMGSYAATFGLTFFMSLYLQYALGMSPRSVGFLLLIQPLTQMLASPLAGRITDRSSPARVANFGIAAICVGLISIALTVGTGAPLWIIAVELVLIGTGFGVFITPNTVAILGSVVPEQYGMASGMIGTVRTLGMVVSMTTITLIFSLLMGGQPVTKATVPLFVSSMQTGLIAFAAFSCSGLIVSIARRQGKKSHPPCGQAGGLLSSRPAKPTDCTLE
ncbi:MAG: MFS transporter [Syntrophobacteraceae bacterium]|jgi:EmrB/QacA subfamily drug resistance transporter